jgi:hypothetical protein
LNDHFFPEQLRYLSSCNRMSSGCPIRFAGSHLAR